MQPQVESLIESLEQFESLSDERRRRAFEQVEWLQSVDDEQLGELFAALAASRLPTDADASSSLLSAALAQIDRASAYEPHQWNPLSKQSVERTVTLYGQLAPSVAGRHHLLRLLAQRGDEAALARLTELLVADPPQSETDVAVVFTPLFRRRNYRADALFPRLLDAVAYTGVAAGALDLANYLTREQLVAEHPGKVRRPQLEELLGRLAQRLAHVEEHPAQYAQTADDMQRTIGESVALVISLCDAMALIGEEASIGKLYQAMELKHRRVRTEASAALARLGEEEGRKTLLELASEPVARLRVLAYADELGIADKIDPQYATPVARAEAELALWLAQPSQFGIPPTGIELLDARTQSWPGSDDEVPCFLFRFRYDLGGTAFANVGIVGPVTVTFAADLNGLSVDDLYALFAGWQSEHEDIYRLDLEHLEGATQVAAQRLAQFLIDAGYTQIQPVWLGSFFGELALVAHAVHDEEDGVAVVDQDGIFWRTAPLSPRSLGPEEVYNLYKGRKILSVFNA
ncbi:MAG: HEAT repeat domain-containing protein [Pirellulaceae bacterium]